ncbi:MAG: anthranilate synthase component I family protein [Bacteroidia bacterium]|nr:anthranilate synthase component I family protein [Bacteroidia bacterium]
MMIYNIFTRYKKTLADLHTPVGIYNKLRDNFPNALLLESADYHDRTDSKSFICLEPIAGFEAKGNSYTIEMPDGEKIQKTTEYAKDIFTAFRSFISKFKPDLQNEIPFDIHGIWGYSSFEAVRYMEDINMDLPVSEAKDNPDLKYQFFKYILVLDHFKNELFVFCNDINESNDFQEEIDHILQLILTNNQPIFEFESLGNETSSIEDEEYKHLVEKGINHCKIGDVFQVVLSREYQQKFRGDDFNLYRCLRSINPSPYLFYFDYGNFKIMGSSPESQLQVMEGTAIINPIAGTILKTGNHEIDLENARKLKEDPKEMSEHVMLVDLARNDLSKKSKHVEIERYAEIQYFSHVIHMVSKVKGELYKVHDGLEVFADTFPAGTLSGAPKYRAMEIIRENEKNARNFYGGALGFIGFNGAINHAIIIRSILSKNNVLSYQAGAGIVINSSPEGELKEVKNKTEAIRKAIEKANEL